MNRKIKLSAAVVATLLISVLAVNMAMASTNVATIANVKTVSSVQFENGLAITPEQANDPNKLRELVPATLEEADKNIYPIRTRFLMWTNDGVHIMWGFYGRGHLVGTDNMGKRCWGIYGNGIFAGFYDGEFFWGRYSNGAWKAQYLFGLRYSSGRFVTFPRLALATAEAVSIVP